MSNHKKTRRSNQADTDRIISCDESALVVRDNLYNALVQLREHGVRGPLWVDAICINQQDLSERSAQVAFMGPIYSKAQSVTVWLGVEDENTEIAIPMLQRIGPHLVNLDHARNALELRSLPFNDRRPFDTVGVPVPSMAEWRALSLFLSRTWFSRLWVLQEVALARGVTVLCGRSRCEWQHITQCV